MLATEKKEMIRDAFLILLGLVGTITFAHAQVADQATDNSVLKKLRANYPNTTFTHISSSPIKGLYEVTMGDNIAYTDEAGRVFIFGHMFDMETQTDLTAVSLQKKEKTVFPFNSLNQAIVRTKGNGQAKLAVFSDPECPYCKKIDAELEKLTNVTIYTFPYPLEQLHPTARETAIAIWCSTDPTATWVDYIRTATLPDTKLCDHPIDQNIALGKKLAITVTPTMIAEDGRVLRGFAFADAIKRWLEQDY